MSTLGPGGRRLAQTTPARPPQGVAAIWTVPGVVTAVTTGAAADGNDLLTVSYSGTEQACAYLASYTPAVNDVVALVVSADGSLFCLGHLIGTP